jgi:hypothetical protein
VPQRHRIERSNILPVRYNRLHGLHSRATVVRSGNAKLTGELIGSVRGRGQVFKDHASLIPEFLADDQIELKIRHAAQTPIIVGSS